MRQDIKRCFEDEIGPTGLSRSEFEAALAHTGPILEELRAAHEAQSLPLLAMPGRSDDLPEIEKLASRLRDEAADIVFCGTGGSSLGGQTLAQAAGWNAPVTGTAIDAAPRIHFADNLDADSYEQLLSGIDLEKAHFVVVSKSGGTAETLAQALRALMAYEAAGLGDKVAGAFTALTERLPGKDNGLKTLAEKFQIPLLEHVRDLGGRYSALSNVGLLPALVAGLDARKVREGAAGILQTIVEGAAPHNVPPAVGAALNVALSERHGISIAVLLAYSDRLERFTRWYVQLWAESLGKDGRGTTPVAALGPVDQHSQLQLYLDGPPDKLFTILITRAAGRGAALDPALAEMVGADYLAGRSMGDMVEAMQQATADSLAKAGRPVRTLAIDSVDAASLGALMMHFMLETIIAAKLIGVDPFDQPAVESGKIIARRLLAEM
ncbi:MAG TPA: glucose-6-phosphate isomerase [Hyphomicrobiales bacterium]|nr:glucose-6-phosphate isomerase [Hyphomicrobiales bacterium]